MNVCNNRSNDCLSFQWNCVVYVLFFFCIYLILCSVGLCEDVFSSDLELSESEILSACKYPTHSLISCFEVYCNYLSWMFFSWLLLLPVCRITNKMVKCPFLCFLQTCHVFFYEYSLKLFKQSIKCRLKSACNFFLILIRGKSRIPRTYWKSIISNWLKIEILFCSIQFKVDIGFSDSIE